MARRLSHHVLEESVIHRIARAALLAGLVAVAAPPLAAQGSMNNTLTPKEKQAGWKLLFDGRSLDQWRGYQEANLPAGWNIEDGVVVKPGSANDIVTREEFGDFELSIDWKLTTGGNAGIFYRATEEYPKVYWSGPEFQLLDDANAPDGKNRLTSAGAAYAIYPSPAGIVHPAGEWNTTRIVVKGNHVEHWLNGKKLLEYELKSPDWTAKVKASKFNAWPHYGLAPKGHIGIQGDHNGELQLRNIKILGR
jgi:hypothetical protein